MPLAVPVTGAGVTGEDDREPVSETIPTNLRLLLVLEEIADAGTQVTPTEINQQLGLPKPTIHRLFATLEAEGFLQREMDGRSYSPGARLRRFAAGVLSSQRVRTVRLAVLTALAAEIGETCNIAVPDRDAMIYLERVETKWPLRIQLPIGSHVPFYCTASGKMYLSTLKPSHLERYLRSAKLEVRAPGTMTDPDQLLAAIGEIREQGFSTDNEEFLEGMIALALPIRDSHNRLLSTVSFHAPTQRLQLADATVHLRKLRSAALSLSELVNE